MPENLIRCFIAVEIPEPILNVIAAYLSKLKQISREVRWVRADTIHLTLKFLGEIERSRLATVQSSLEGISAQANPFSLEISGCGAFPGKSRPRVFWLGMSADKESPLLSVQRWIEKEMADLGFESENRRFSPHLTLGRVKSPADFSDIFRYFDKHPFPPMRFNVDHVALIQSHLKPSGAEYEVLREYRF